MALVRIISHPFRLAAGGAVATVEQDTDAANAEQIAVLAMTRAGERPMVPGFGLTDPAFAGFRPAELVAGIQAWGPPVAVGEVATRPADDATELVTVEFT
jgi:hypothetical protein